MATVICIFVYVINLLPAKWIEKKKQQIYMLLPPTPLIPPSREQNAQKNLVMGNNSIKYLYYTKPPDLGLDI